MSERLLEKKSRRDAAKIKKDLSNLAEDGAQQLSGFGKNINETTTKAKVDLTAWVDDGVSQISEGLEKMTGDARETVTDAAATMKKEIGLGLNQYNSTIQEVAAKLPGSFAKKAVKYPWVAMSIALGIGILLGSLLKPAQQPLG